jgi:hypothetical protein
VTRKSKCCEYGSWDYIHKTLYFLYLIDGPNKLERLQRATKRCSVMQHSSLLGTSVSYEENLIDMNMATGTTVTTLFSS